MNYRSLVLFCALGCSPGLDVFAETEVAPAGDVVVARAEPAPLTPAQLDDLLSPVALYPDPLIALILPASTFPTDVVMAARYLKAGGDPRSIDDQPWDDSVKALARYPDVVKWMDENLAWTRQLGEVFERQPAALLTSTQRLRAAARTAGNLASTPEQTVVVEREVIRIVPSRPDVIYVPVYDPLVVYRPRVANIYHTTPVLRFGDPCRTGFWLSYHCDWTYNTVWMVSRPYRVEIWSNHPRWACPAPSTRYVQSVWRPDRGNRVRTVSREPETRNVGRKEIDTSVAGSSPTVIARPSPDRPAENVGRITSRGPNPSATNRIDSRSDAEMASATSANGQLRQIDNRRLQMLRGTPQAGQAPAPVVKPESPAPTSQTEVANGTARRIQFGRNPTDATETVETAPAIRASARPGAFRVSDSTRRPTTSAPATPATATRLDEQSGNAAETRAFGRPSARAFSPAQSAAVSRSRASAGSADSTAVAELDPTDASTRSRR